MDQEKKSLSSVLILMCVMVGLTAAYQYQTINELYVFSSTLSSRLYKIIEKGYLFRFIYIVVVAATAFLFLKQLSKEKAREGD